MKDYPENVFHLNDYYFVFRGNTFGGNQEQIL